jgi:predicted RNA-binding protein YlqC (UPF0109 family)
MEFSKVIGKGGQNINKLRDMSGANIKGTEFNPDERLIVINGSPGEVLDAFDGIVDHVQQHVYNHTQRDEFTLQILVEHSKAGRVIGNKGSTIQLLKNKSGAINIRMLKDQKDYTGVKFRILCIDGNHLSIKKAHYYVQELFVDPVLLAAAAATPANAPAIVGAVNGQQRGSPRSSVFDPPGYGAEPALPQPAIPQPAFISTSPHAFSTLAPQEQQARDSLPLDALTSFGVLPETTHQLIEMKAYLSRHFGLLLRVCKENSLLPQPTSVPESTPAPMGMIQVGMHSGVQLGQLDDTLYHAPHGVVAGMQRQEQPFRYASSGVDDIDRRQGEARGYQDEKFGRRESREMRMNGDIMADSTELHFPHGNVSGSSRHSATAMNAEEGDIVFSVPKSSVGFIKGKGGQTLKDLQVREVMYIEIQGHFYLLISLDT